jgi:hypothetical protein
MLGADLQELRRIGVMRERTKRVRAMQRERMSRRELVPEAFERDGRFAFALLPQQRDHFTECMHVRVPRAHFFELSPDDVGELVGVGPPVDHEARQRGRRVERNVASGASGSVDVGAGVAQPPLQRFAMRLGGDDDGAAARPERRADMLADLLEQEVDELVELYHMVARDPRTARSMLRRFRNGA